MRVLTALLFLSAAVGAQTPKIYRWTDKKGEVHYTDDLSSVPKGAKAETTEGEELMVEPPKPARPTPAPVAPSAPSSEGEFSPAETYLESGAKITGYRIKGNNVRRLEPSPPQAPAKQSGPVEVKITRVLVEVSDADRQYIEESIRTAAASPRLTSWGGLRESVAVEITPGEQMRGYAGTDAFGRAVGSKLMQLRAPKDVRSSGFSLDYPGTALHELVHLLEKQVATGSSPPWFAEGFACVVADQIRFAAIDDVAYWVIHDGGARPLDTLMGGRVDIRLAYAVAREAVRYLIELVGEAGIKSMFEQRAKGVFFEAAFKSVAGFDVIEFQAKFINSLRPNYYERAR